MSERLPKDWGEFEARIKKILESLDRISEVLRSVIFDEASEARAYRDLALAARDPAARYALAVIAFDSIVHREILWSLLRALECAKMMFEDLLKLKAQAPQIDVAEHAEVYRSIEELARASYRDLVSLAVPGTTLRRLLELLAEEEDKHMEIVKKVVERLAG